MASHESSGSSRSRARSRGSSSIIASRESRSSSFSGIRRLWRAHYVLHALALATVLPLRWLLLRSPPPLHHPPPPSPSHPLSRSHMPAPGFEGAPQGSPSPATSSSAATAFPWTFLQRGAAVDKSAAWEIHMLAALLFSVLYKMWRLSTPEAIFASVVFNFEAVALFLLWSVRPPVCAWYFVLLALLHVFCPQPDPRAPDGGDDDLVRELTARQLEGLATEGCSVTCLVFMYTNWSSQCRQMYPIFAHLSNRYSGSQLQFGRIDVGRFPRMADMMGIDCSVLSSNVPALFLFHRGRVVARLPAASEGISALAAVTGPGAWFTKALVIRHFQLDLWLARNLQADDKAS